MKSQLLLSALAASLLSGCIDHAQSATDASRQLWLNGDIYTVNEKQPWADSMVVQSDTTVCECQYQN